MSHLVGATTTKRGAVVLAGHLGGTANSPTVVNHSQIVATDDLHTEYLLAAGTRALSGDMSAGSNKITSLGNGTADGDAVNYGQLIGQVRGLDGKVDVRVATAAALPANTRTGNVLTADANGALNDVGIDAITTLALNDRVLVQDEVTGANNGLFHISDLGSAGTPWTLTRAVDADVDAEVTFGLFVSAAEGTANAGETFKLTTPNPITLNTTALTFVNFNVALSFGSPAALAAGATSDGVANTSARSDHNHGTIPAAGGDDFGSAAFRWDYFGVDVDFSGKQVDGLTQIADTDSPYSLAATDYRVEVASGAGAVTINLPAAPSHSGRTIKIKRIGANDVTIDGNAAETIDGAATLVLDADYEAVTLYCNGSGWGIE